MNLYHLVFCLTLLLVDNVTARSPHKQLQQVINYQSSINEHPYTVSLEYNGFTICAGSIISEDLVLTAAHCTLDNANFRNVKVRACSTYPLFNGSLHYVDKYYRHENFRMDRFMKGRIPVNDVALIKVNPPFDLKYSSCQPVLLYETDQVDKPEMSEGIVSGWGKMPAQVTGWTRDDQAYKRLKHFTVRIFDQSYCADMYLQKAQYSLQPGQMCVGFAKNSPCIRDVGNPLVVRKKQAGIASWTLVCEAEETLPSAVYMDVAYFRIWIDEVATLMSDYIVDFSVLPSNREFIIQNGRKRYIPHH